MSHIESRLGCDESGYDFYVEFICETEDLLDQLTKNLEAIASRVSLMTEGGRGNKGESMAASRIVLETRRLLLLLLLLLFICCL